MLIAVPQMITGGLSKSTEKQLYARLLGQAGTGRKGSSSLNEGEVKVSDMCRCSMISFHPLTSICHLQLCYVTVSEANLNLYLALVNRAHPLFP